MAIDGRAPQPRPLLLLRARVRRPRNRNIRHVRRAIGYVRHRRSDDLGPHRARAGLLAAHRRLHIVWPATAFFPEDSDGSGRRTQISTWRSSSGRCANSSVRRTDSSSRGMHVRATHARDISRPKLGPDQSNTTQPNMAGLPVKGCIYSLSRCPTMYPTRASD